MTATQKILVFGSGYFDISKHEEIVQNYFPERNLKSEDISAFWNKVQKQEISRDDPRLIESVKSASIRSDKLFIIEIPDNVSWKIKEMGDYREVVVENITNKTWEIFYNKNTHRLASLEEIMTILSDKIVII